MGAGPRCRARGRYRHLRRADRSLDHRTAPKVLPAGKGLWLRRTQARFYLHRASPGLPCCSMTRWTEVRFSGWRRSALFRPAAKSPLLDRNRALMHQRMHERLLLGPRSSQPGSHLIPDVPAGAAAFVKIREFDGMRPEAREARAGPLPPARRACTASSLWLAVQRQA